jgi:hypothetical protein
MATFMAWSPSHRRQTSASDQNADGNLDCENREDDHNDQQCFHTFAPQ